MKQFYSFWAAACLCLLFVLPLPAKAQTGMTIEGPDVGCVGSTSFYYAMTDGSCLDYEWSVSGGTFTKDPWGGIQVTWTSTGGYISVYGISCVDSNYNGVYLFASKGVTVYNKPTVTVSASATSVCAGQAVNLTATGANSYHWTTNQSTSSITVYPQSTTTYRVFGYGNGQGCNSAYVDITIHVKPQPLAIITAAGPTTFCAGGNVQLNGSTGSGYTFRWTRNGAYISDGSSITASQGGTYLLATTLNGCTATSAPLTVTVNPLPVAYSLTGGGSYCAGGSGMPVGLSGSQAGVNYQLRRNNVSVGTALAGTGGPLSFGRHTVGAYTVIATNASTGCTGNMASSVNVSTAALPAAPGVVAGSRFGAGPATLVVSSPQAGFSYRWYTAATGGQVLHTGTSFTPAVAATTTYYVTAVSSQGCESSSRTGVTATVHPQPLITVQSGSTSLAPGASVTLSTSQPYTTYQWLENGVPLPGKTGATFTTRFPGSYTVQVTIAAAANSATATAVPVRRARDWADMNYVVENTVTKPGVESTGQADMLSIDSVSQKVTYFDGLGRPIQTVLTQASPKKNDIVTPVTYDSQGRIDKTYLPYVQGSGGGYRENAVPELRQFYDPNTFDNPAITKSANPWAVPVYEASPLNRLLKQGAPGDAWQPLADGETGEEHSIKMAYRANGTNEARIWNFVAGVTFTQAYYEPGTLHVTETRDEQGSLSVEYKDLQGRVVMKKVQEATTVNSQTETGFLITQYVYDDLGNLRIVIQPEGYRSNLPAAVSGKRTLSTAFLQNWAFFYEYDGRRRVVRKRMPGAGNVDIVYNRLDQPILTQDAVQRGPGSWSFTKYDVLGRPIMQGDLALKTTAGVALTREQVQAAADLVVQQHEERTKTSATVPAGLGYTLTKAYPNIVETNLRSITYYDDYDYAYLANYTFQPEAGVLAIDQNTSLRGQVTATRTKVMGTSNTWLVAVNFYDSKYRLLQTVSDSYLAGALALRADRTTTRYDFTGTPLETLLTHKKGTATHIINNEFSYDHTGRPLKTLQRMGTDTTTVTLSELGYNEIGQLVTKKLHAKKGEGPLQKVDMRYNERGWLTKINDRTLAPQTGDPHPDLFGFELTYNDGLQLGTVNEAQFNGNISEALWATASDKVQRGYLYRYDKANRLSKASYKAKGATSWNIEQGNYSLPGISYDANGNILKLHRRGLTAGHPYNTTTPTRTWGVVDSLAYTYAGNKLLAVNDLSPAAGPAGDFRDNGVKLATEYTYDANGNLLTDKNKGITAITYNQFNLPTKITFGTKGNIEYTYSAAGQKLRKKVTEGAKITYTDYAGMFVYQGDTLFAHTSEGRVLYQPLVNDKWRYEYHLKDHLGNLRVSFAEATSTTNMATMETMAARQEEENFDNVDKTRHQDMARSRTGSHAALLSTGRDKPIGPAKRVNLQAGDSLKVEAFGMFETERKRDITFSLLSWLASSAAVTTGMNAGGEMGKSKQSKGLPYIGAGLALAPQVFQKEERAPKAYLRYIVYDKDSTYVTSGYKALGREANKGWEKLELEYKAEQDGYAEVYVANESTEEAWFDDMAVTVTEPMLVQENHYDPWGLNLAGIEKQGTPSDHKFQYNGIEKQSDLGLNVFMAKYRTLDPQLGRWWQIDPKVEALEALTPYNSNLNNPIRYDDPDGDLPPALWGAIIGAGLGAGIEYGAQVYNNYSSSGTLSGETFTNVNGTKILAAGAEGLIAGAVAGATGNLALGKSMAANSVAQVVGGGVKRAINGEKVLNAGAIITDAAAGAAGGAAANIITNQLTKKGASEAAARTVTSATGKAVLTKAVEKLPSAAGRAAAKTTVKKASEAIKEKAKEPPKKELKTPI